MAEEKEQLGPEIESLKAISLNGNGVHDDEGSTASGTVSEQGNGKASKAQEGEAKARTGPEGSESLQSHRVVSCLLSDVRAPSFPESELCPPA